MKLFRISLVVAVIILIFLLYNRIFAIEKFTTEDKVLQDILTQEGPVRPIGASVPDNQPKIEDDSTLVQINEAPYCSDYNPVNIREQKQFPVTLYSEPDHEYGVV